MDNGRIADRNLALTATLTGGAWAAALPLNNLKADRRFLSAPARQTTPADLSASRFDAALSLARSIDLVALLFHTFSLTAKYRLTIAPPGGSFAAPAYSSGWRAVYERVFDSLNLDWSDPNWWTGQASDEEDIALYARHLWITLPTPVLAGAVRVEIDDSQNPSGFFDIGGLWIALTWAPRINFERGRRPEIQPRDQSEEAPAGRLFPDERTPRRRHVLSWKRLSDAEAQRLFDAGARARTSRTVLVLPDTSDPGVMIREAFPAVFDPPPTPTYRVSGLNEVEAGFKEIIA